MLEHEVDFRGDTARVVYDPAEVSIAEIEDALGTIGYRPETAREVSD